MRTLVYYYQGVGNFEIVSFVVESGRKLVSYFSKFPGYHNKVNRVYHDTVHHHRQTVSYKI